MASTTDIPSQRGATLVEVLVTMVILAIGLLGLVGLQGRIQLLQLEAYQRAQALILLDDMANRMANNRYDIESYETGATPLGTGMTCPTPAAGASRQSIDEAEWCEALIGAGELSAANSAVGAMLGGRGCVEDIDNGDYLITVAWQGLAPIAAPPENVTCGEGEYDGGANSECANDLCRRVVTTVVHIPDLTL